MVVVVVLAIGVPHKAADILHEVDKVDKVVMVAKEATAVARSRDKAAAAAASNGRRLVPHRLHTICRRLFTLARLLNGLERTTIEHQKGTVAGLHFLGTVGFL